MEFDRYIHTNVLGDHGVSAFKVAEYSECKKKKRIAFLRDIKWCS
jgi:hypothetical protein